MPYTIYWTDYRLERQVSGAESGISHIFNLSNFEFLGFQILVIWDLQGINFHATVVLALIFHLGFKLLSALCAFQASKSGDVKLREILEIFDLWKIYASNDAFWCQFHPSSTIIVAFINLKNKLFYEKLVKSNISKQGIIYVVCHFSNEFSIFSIIKAI